MSLHLPSTDQVIAVGRHVATSAGTAVTILSILHVVNGDQAAQVTNSVQQIAQGVGLIWAGVGPLIVIASGVWAAYAQSWSAKIKSVNGGDNGVKVVPESSPTKSVDGPLK